MSVTPETNVPARAVLLALLIVALLVAADRFHLLPVSGQAMPMYGAMPDPVPRARTVVPRTRSASSRPAVRRTERRITRPVRSSLRRSAASSSRRSTLRWQWRPQ